MAIVSYTETTLKGNARLISWENLSANDTGAIYSLDGQQIVSITGLKPNDGTITAEYIGSNQLSTPSEGITIAAISHLSINGHVTETKWVWPKADGGTQTISIYLLIKENWNN